MQMSQILQFKSFFSAKQKLHFEMCEPIILEILQNLWWKNDQTYVLHS